MVKNRRRQVVLLATLGVAAAASLYYGFGGGPGAPYSGGTAKSRDAASFEVDEVLPIDLDRVAKLRESAARDGEIELDFDRGGRGGSASGQPTPMVVAPPVVAPATGLRGVDGEEGAGPPVGPALPPMNLRYLGAVQAPDGAWFAALVTDRKELLTGKEGDVIANRFRIVKIGVESVDLLETTSGRQRRVRLGGSS